jgi:MHS family proline/betaine transporter-like MFS transporter
VILALPAALLATRGSHLGLVVGQVAIGIAVAGVLSVAMLGEAFPASVRSTGVALTAGIATALIGGTAPWIDHVLVRVTAGAAAPGVYVAAIGILALLALWRWPETAFSSLD